MAVALSFAIGFAHAEGWAWGVARSQGADVLALSATNANGAAVLSDADLAGKSVDEIKFTSARPGADELTVGGIVLSNRTIRFAATDSLVLRGDGTNSVFRLSGSSGNWTLDGLDLRGIGMTDANPEFGGAVECFGGMLTLSGCSFTDFFANQVGGAVCAALMDGDVTVTNCSFSANGVGAYNGYGGAVYATGKGQEYASARLVIADSEFVGNLAENGGAICTRTRLSDDEKPMAADIRDGTAFVGNVADFGGGAVLSEGPLAISGPETSFVGNFAGDDGGAVCIEGSAEDSLQVKMTVSNGVAFADNCVSSRVDWVSGGAISVMTPGCELEVVGATFSNNWAHATSEGASAQCAFGGAVSTAPGCTNLFRKTAFVGNGVQSVAPGAGGAVSACEGETVVDNCVFDCRGTTAANCYGSAVDFDAVRGTVRNTTIRYGATEAVSSVDAELTIVNCVVVGNGAALGDGAADFRFEGSSTVDMTYSAYGSCAADAAVEVAESFNLSNRVAEAVYEGDTLRLDPTGFNPVVELGLVQPDATDFDGIPYVSSGTAITFPRASMGAYELATDHVLVLDVFGKKDYDATTRSNGCVWAWKLTDTNGVAIAYDDLVPTNLDAAAASDYLAERFAITNWVFGTEENGGAVGLYDSTNETDSAWWLDAGVAARTERVNWLGSVLVLRARGEIGQTWFVLPVDFGDGETNGVYFTWNWMKDNLNRYPTNDFETSCDILRAAQENGYPRWQNYVMGVDGSDPSNRIVTTYAPCASGASDSRVDVVTPIAAFAPPAKVGVEMEYRLYNVTHTRRGILPEDGESWHCYATNSVPRFEGFDLSKLHYGLKDQDRDYGQCLLEIYAIFKKGDIPEGAKAK